MQLRDESSELSVLRIQANEQASFPSRGFTNWSGSGRLAIGSGLHRFK